MRYAPWIVAVGVAFAAGGDIGCGKPDCEQRLSYTLDAINAICDGDGGYCSFTAINPPYCGKSPSAACAISDCPSAESFAACFKKTCSGGAPPTVFRGKYDGGVSPQCEYVATEYCS